MENQNTGKNDLTHVSIIPIHVFMYYMICFCIVFT